MEKEPLTIINPSTQTKMIAFPVLHFETGKHYLIPINGGHALAFLDYQMSRYLYFDYNGRTVSYELEKFKDNIFSPEPQYPTDPPEPQIFK